MAIRFYHYSNPSHTVANGACCDFANCTADCNTYLVLKFIFRNVVGVGEFDLGLGYIGGDSVIFTDTVGNEENPFVQRYTLPVCIVCSSSYLLA